MKNITYLSFAAFLFLISCNTDSNTFVITNHSEFDRSDEPIVINRGEVTDKTGPRNNNMLPVVYHNNNMIPSQADDIDQDGSWDELAFTLNLAAHESKTVSIRYIESSEYPAFPARTNIRFGVKNSDGVVENLTELTIAADEVPTEPFARFQMDGPAWENDKIGFRQYIDGRNARDLYGKKLSAMALDTVGISPSGGLEDNYHVMLPWGRDILAVGNSLGLGGVGILNNGQPVRVGVRLDDERNNVDFTTYKLIKEGPVRSIFTLNYNGWKVGEQKLSLENTVTIWAGNYGYKNSINLTSNAAADTLLVGLVNIHNDNPPILNKENPEYTLFSTFDKQTYDKEFYLGMALALPADKYLSYERSPDEGEGILNTYLNLIELTEEKSFEYYVFAGWELSTDSFTNPEYFQDYIIHSAQKLSNPVTIE